MAQDSNARARAGQRDDDPVDSFFEIPAAVLCAACGQSDCPGCVTATEQQSGVIAIIPWERSGPVWGRLWATAHATTQGAEAFFAVMPDGEIPPAMRFAVLAELLAVLAMAVSGATLAALALPNLALAVVESPYLRGRALFWAALGVPALTLWMIGAHVTHGAALDAGARRQGALPQRRRAVRFGLYACGWDLMSGPLGAVVSFFKLGGSPKAGGRDGLGLWELTVKAPGLASRAFLQGVYQLEGERLSRARRAGSIATALLIAGSAIAVLAALVLRALR